MSRLVDADTHIVVSDTGAAEEVGPNRTQLKIVFNEVGSPTLPEMRLSHNMNTICR